MKIEELLYFIKSWLNFAFPDAWGYFNAGLFFLKPRLAGGHPSSGCWHSSTGLCPRQDLCRLPSLPATVLSRSDCDWTGVSLSPLIAITPGATLCLQTAISLPAHCGSWRTICDGFRFRVINGTVLNGGVFSFKGACKGSTREVPLAENIITGTNDLRNNRI